MTSQTFSERTEMPDGSKMMWNKLSEEQRQQRQPVV